MLTSQKVFIHSSLASKHILECIVICLFCSVSCLGMLCRWFKYLYANDVVEEDAFLNWKEEVTDKYPGKGTALFQVNTWLTLLQEAESEEDDE